MWINVKDKLPLDNVEVLITDGKTIDVGEMWSDVYGCFVETQEYMPWKEVTHWQPLPPLPQEQEIDMNIYTEDDL